MKLVDYIKVLEAVSPKELALSYDNVGLLIDTDREIRSVLVALDCTVDVAKEAEERCVDLVLTHHPIFFHAIQRLSSEADPDAAAAFHLIRAGIGLYAAHTNLDACAGGVNDALCERLMLHDVRPFGDEPIGRIGTLATPTTLSDFIDLCEEQLHTRARFCGEAKQFVQTVGVVGGAGGDLAWKAKALGCDVFVTGEMKHHEAIAANFAKIACVVLGHYETESVVLKNWISRLQNAENSVRYILSTFEKSPLTSR